MIQLFSFHPRCKRPDNSIWRVRHKKILLLLLLFAVSPRLFFPPHPPWVLFYCLKFNRINFFFAPNSMRYFCVFFVSTIFYRKMGIWYKRRRDYNSREYLRILENCLWITLSNWYRKWSNKRRLSNKRLLSNKRSPYAVKFVLNAPL